MQKYVRSFVIAAEICEDLWTPNPPVTAHAMHGATVLVNCSASNETIGKASYRRELVKGESARLVSAYIYSSAGEGESTQDIVFSGHNLIAEKRHTAFRGRENLPIRMCMPILIWKELHLKRRRNVYIYGGYRLFRLYGDGI